MREGRLREDLLLSFAWCPQSRRLESVRMTWYFWLSIFYEILQTEERGAGTFAVQARYPWPGNVRRLENNPRLVLMSDDDLRQAISDSDVVDGTNAPTNTAFGAQDAKPVTGGSLRKEYSGGN